MVLLSAKAGLRAGEIARLTWAMITDPTGDIGTVLELPDRAAKKGSGRVIPLHRFGISAVGNVVLSEPSRILARVFLRLDQ